MKQIKIDLQMGGRRISSLEELREYANEELMTFFEDGRLLTWLKSRGLSEQTVGVERIRCDGDTFRIMGELCTVLKVSKGADENVARRWASVYEFEKAVDYEKNSGEPLDLTESFKLYRRAAELEHDKALDMICDPKYLPAPSGCLWVSRGVECDMGPFLSEEAVTKFALYNKAAETGHHIGEARIGDCYLKGIGVERNPVEAVKWYRLAAEQGHADAQFALGECYKKGDGVEKNDCEAAKWFWMGLKQDASKAKDHVIYCLTNGSIQTEDDKALARKLAIWCGLESAFMLSYKMMSKFYEIVKPPDNKG